MAALFIVARTVMETDEWIKKMGSDTYNYIYYICNIMDILHPAIIKAGKSLICDNIDGP